LVPNMKIEASGRNTRGNIMNMSMPILNGLTMSKPRTWRMGVIAVLIRESRESGVGSLEW